MIRLFNVYYPTRILMLLAGEVVLVVGSFVLAATCISLSDTYISLFYEDGFLKIGCITLITVLLSYYFDLYEPRRISGYWETNFRLLLVLSVLSFTLAGMVYLFPGVNIGPHVLTVGIAILAVLLVLWRRTYEWMVKIPFLCEQVYVLGDGERAETVVRMLKVRPDCGMDVIEHQSQDVCACERDRLAADLRSLSEPKLQVTRVIVAMEDRRETMPVRELLELRMSGVVIEDATTLIERLSGKMALEGLNPSTFIFTRGIKIHSWRRVTERAVSIGIALAGLIVCLAVIPFLVLAVRVSSPGPIFFRQTRVGIRGRRFSLFKFRTMRQDAEKNGAVWATKNDSRITSIGKMMRRTRLDEIPQLWNVLCGDMEFVGPRPERPEFVEWLSKEIPFYELRHMIRPGLTGWAQVRYRYGASLEETKRKLEYDLYYLKHKSISLDLLIIFETVKTILLGRGAQ